MKVYKATDKDLKCRGYQFTPGVEAVEESAKLCEAGFHACEAPLDVMAYYAPGDGSRYFEAELEDVSDERSDSDSKVVGKRITLGAEIGIPGLAKAHVEWVESKVKKHDTGGDMSALTGGDGSCIRGESNSKYRGGMWSVFACTLRDNDYRIIGVKTAIVDGKKIKADTWYRLEDGEFVESEA